MTHIRLAAVILGLIWATACSSTNNSSNNPQPTRGTDKFSVNTEDGSGSFNPVLDVVESGDTTTVTITALQADDLSAAFVHLNYDPAQYSPVGVEFGDFLGSKDEVITLALTDVAGDVPLGVVQIADSGVAPQSGSGLIATVTFQAVPFVGTRSASAPPGNTSAVDDLVIINQTPADVDLEWTEKNAGDYDNNGLVTISDISPLGLFINKAVNETADPVHAGMVDGDGNGMITLADLSTIGANFGNQITGYHLFYDAACTEFAIEVLRPTEYNNKAPIVYSVPCGTNGDDEFCVRPIGTTPAELGPISNIAYLVIEEGAPAPPGNLIAQTSPTVGHLKIRLSWQASTSGDVRGYMIERKLASDPDTSFVDLLTAPYNGTVFTDQIGLQDVDYTYRVRARDKENPAQDSVHSNTVTAHPYVFVLSPPQNVTANPGGGSSAIQISWDAPSDGSAERFTVYRKAAGEPGFTAIFTSNNSSITDTVDKPLTEGVDYEYYVTSRDTFLTLESGESNHDTSQCSAAVAFEILGITTDKWNHHTGGSEPDSNISVTTSLPADSYVWTASQGAVTGSGASVKYKPGAGATPGPVTITCTATKSGVPAVASLTLGLTSETIKTQYGNSGKFIDFSDQACLAQPTAPFRPFSWYADGDSVVLFNWWETWCGPCRAEFPDFHEWCVEYGSAGFWYVGNNQDDNLAGTQSFYDLFSPKLSPEFQNYYLPPPGNMSTLWSKYGFTGGIPTSILFDKDGYARLQAIGTISGAKATQWENCIANCSGVPVQ